MQANPPGASAAPGPDQPPLNQIPSHDPNRCLLRSPKAANKGKAFLSKTRSQEQLALVEQFTKHRARLRKSVEYRLSPKVRSRVDPEDVLQEAFLVAADRLDHYLRSFRSSLANWIQLVVEQTLVNVHRRHIEAEKRSVLRDSPLESMCSLSSDPTRPIQNSQYLNRQVLNPHQIACQREASARLRAALDRLGEPDRAVLQLRHFQAKSNQEVARILGIRPKAASIRYARALQRLKQILLHKPSRL